VSEAALVATIGTFGILGAAAVAWLTAAQAATRRNLAQFARENRALWYYTRHLIDWGYTHSTEPPPAPPESIRHLYEFGETP
jgi:hypothetical protein